MSRILIVEDELAIAELEKDYLELSEFEVVIETDGIAGLDRALAEDFDMIDNIVPYIGGEEEKTEKECLKILGKVKDGKNFCLTRSDTGFCSVY